MLHWFHFCLLVLACFRLTRLLIYDKITEFMRRPFHKTIEETLPDGSIEEFIEIRGTGLRNWIGELLSCHWCTGLWCAVILYASYLNWPKLAVPVITILAIAGGASMIQTYVDKRN